MNTLTCRGHFGRGWGQGIDLRNESGFKVRERARAGGGTVGRNSCIDKCPCVFLHFCSLAEMLNVCLILKWKMVAMAQDMAGTAALRARALGMKKWKETKWLVKKTPV